MKKTTQIKVLALNVDNLCTSSCVHCPYGASNQRRLNVSFTLGLIDEFHKKGGEVVVLAAREPLLPKTFREVSIFVIDHAKKLGLHVGVNVSMTHLLSGVKRLKEANLKVDSLYVSLDGVSGVHDSVRGVAEEHLFSEILRNQSDILSITRGLGISVTVMKQNLPVLSETLILAKSLCLGENIPFVATCSPTGTNQECLLETGDFKKVNSVISQLGGTEDFILELTNNSVPVKDMVGSTPFQGEQGNYYTTHFGNTWRFVDDKNQMSSPILRVLSSGYVYTTYSIEDSSPIAMLGVQTPEEILLLAMNSKNRGN